MIAPIIKSLICVVVLAAPALAQPWRYVDKSGAVHYTSNPAELPLNRQKRAIEQRERLKAKRAARKIVEAQKAEQIKAQAILSPAGVPAPVDQPVIINNEAVPQKIDPKAQWRTQVDQARQRVLKARTAKAEAKRAAERASRRAIVNPSGFAYAAHKKAQDAQIEKSRALIEAEAALQNIERAKPR